MPRKSIVWLASYPKSGNTWMRVFLANYLFDRPSPMPINEIHKIGMGDAITKTYAMAAGQQIDPADDRRTLNLRRKVLGGIVANDADINFVKTHNIRDKALGADLIPASVTKSAIYVIRNPLDVAVSFGRHYSQTPETTVAAFANPQHVVLGAGPNVTQFLGTWSAHVMSWTRHRDFPVLTLRYEDLSTNPEECFGRLIEHLGMAVDPKRLEKAIRFSSFDELKGQEQKAGFIEQSANGSRFFHTGTTEQWRTALTSGQIAKLRDDHGPVMREFGYDP